MTLDATACYPYVGASQQEPHSTSTRNLINPANGQRIVTVIESDDVDVDRAVQAAISAQRTWVGWNAAARVDVLLRWADLVHAHRAELGEFDTTNMGRVLKEAVDDAVAAPRMIRYWAGYVDRMLGDQIPAVPGYLSYTVREPLGVIGVILPWNGPLGSFCSRVAPALACGNAAVVKPSEWSPQSALRLAALLTEAGAPQGLVNVVPGAGDTGAALTAHPDVHGITFTGSVPTGRAIARSAADTFKKVVLEMGGKSPNIVFDDADLVAALKGSVWGIFNNAGQVCVAGTRLLVQASIADQFVERLRTAAEQVRVGDPTVATTHMGPLCSQPQFDRVMGYLDIARGEGARLLTGGGAPAGSNPDGLFLQPTILTDLHSEMRVAREEIFGPVLSVLTFDDEEHAVALANDTPYGLSANIWTRDNGRMLRMAQRVEAGTIWGNTMRLHHPALPFGGFKQSGLGGAYADGAIDGSTRLRRVSIRFDDSARAPGWDDLDV